jgi:hypothetical protein
MPCFQELRLETVFPRRDLGPVDGICENDGRCSGNVEEGSGTVSSFGNFVFSGLRCNSGIRHQGDADSYLRGEDGLQ